MTLIYPVSASEDNSELAVYFEEAVGDATITVYDASNQVVYQEVIDTDSQSAAIIDISAWSSGDYTLTISYGTTNLIGEFTIE
jgi:Flp pilus assembly secretin CpaC